MKHWKPTTTRASTERGRPDPPSELVEARRATEMQQRSRPVLPDVDFPDRERDLIDLFGPRHHSEAVIFACGPQQASNAPLCRGGRSGLA